MMRMDDERWYTVAELAARWRLNVEVLRRWIRRGDVEALALGGKAGYRIRASEVERFEQERIKKRRGDG